MCTDSYVQMDVCAKYLSRTFSVVWYWIWKKMSSGVVTTMMKTAPRWVLAKLAGYCSVANWCVVLLASLPYDPPILFGYVVSFADRAAYAVHLLFLWKKSIRLSIHIARKSIVVATMQWIVLFSLDSIDVTLQFVAFPAQKQLCF